MRTNKIWKSAITGLFLMSCAASAYGQQAPAAEKEPDPLVVLKEACDYLKSLQQFSFHSEVIDEQVYNGGKKLQYGIDMKTLVKRPDMLRVDAVGDIVNKHFFFNGKTITLYDKNANIFASISVPPDIEAALETANKDFGVRVALTDLASPELWDLVSKKIQHSLYVGMSNVRGIPCHHLAFDNSDIHLQVWIDAGEKPLPRKIVLMHKTLEGSPEWIAYLSDWQISPHLANAQFNFVPPPAAQKVKFAAAGAPLTPGEKEEKTSTPGEKTGGKS
jgi:hypothetical protein